MGYKELGKVLNFLDVAFSKSMGNNRSVKMMERINQIVKFKNIEVLLKEHCDACPVK